MAGERLDRAAAPMRTLAGEPCLEIRRAFDAEPLEELPTHQRRGPRPVLRVEPSRQAVHIQVDRFGREPQLVAFALERTVAQVLAKRSERDVQGVARLGLCLFRPE